jgi:cytoskeletal protein CcmA (bactofilin family)
MWRRTVVAAMVGALAVPALAHAQRQGLPSSPFGYGVFAISDVTLRDGVRAVVGDVGANNGTVVVGKQAAIRGSVAAATIKLRKPARPGSYFCQLLQGATPGIACEPVTLPLVSSSQLPPVLVTPGTLRVSVPPHSFRAALPPGPYADVRVGPRGQLVLAGGTYAVRSIRVQPRGQLLCAAPCRIGVADTVRLQPNAVLAGMPGTSAREVRVDVARTAPSPVFATAPRATVGARVYAPGGRIELRNQGNYVGAFVGNEVRVGKGAIVQADGS